MRAPVKRLAESTSAACGLYAWPKHVESQLNAMATFVFRLINPRPTFAQDMTDEERDVMARHAAHWKPYLDSGQMVVFGPILDDTGSWGLGIVEAADEQELRVRRKGPGRHDGHGKDRARPHAHGIRTRPVNR
jgi:YCII-related domain